MLQTNKRSGEACANSGNKKQRPDNTPSPLSPTTPPCSPPPLSLTPPAVVDDCSTTTKKTTAKKGIVAVEVDVKYPIAFRVDVCPTSLKPNETYVCDKPKMPKGTVVELRTGPNPLQNIQVVVTGKVKDAVRTYVGATITMLNDDNQECKTTVWEAGRDFVFRGKEEYYLYSDGFTIGQVIVRSEVPDCLAKTAVCWSPFTSGRLIKVLGQSEYEEDMKTQYVFDPTIEVSDS